MSNQRKKPTSIVDDFLKQLLRKMRAQGISQTELAKRLDCSKSNVSKLLNGKSNLQVATMERLAKALEVEVAVGLQLNGPCSDEARSDAADSSCPELSPQSSAQPVRGTAQGQPKRRDEIKAKARAVLEQLPPEVREEIAALVSNLPKSRGRKPGPLYDYSAHLANMAQRMVKSGMKLRERGAAARASEWAKKQGLAHVSPKTLRTYFAEDREALLDAARRRLNQQTSAERSLQPRPAEPLPEPNVSEARPARRLPTGSDRRGSSGLTASSPLSSLGWVNAELSRIQAQYQVDRGLMQILREPYLLEKIAELDAAVQHSLQVQAQLPEIQRVRAELETLEHNPLVQAHLLELQRARESEAQWHNSPIFQAQQREMQRVCGEFEALQQNPYLQARLRELEATLQDPRFQAQLRELSELQATLDVDDPHA